MADLLNIAQLNIENHRPLGNTQFSGLLLFTTFAFVSIHIWSHRFHQLFKRYEIFISSFSAGLAITYVFLHLFPSLEEATATLGRQIHLITLLGFIIFYGIKSLVLQNSLSKKAQAHRTFYIEIFFLATYNALIIFTLPEHLEAAILEIVPYLLAMGLHLLSVNYKLAQDHSQQLYKRGCVILVGSLLVGFLVDVYIDPLVNSLISDMLTAILAGFILFNAFVEELPHPKTSTFLWFVLGIIFYVVLLEF